MAEILSFSAKAKAATDASSEQGFLHEEDHTLSFQVTETGHVGITNILEHRTESPKLSAHNDWSNQELADLYRVKRLLDAAGVPNELDRGLTDEGDPWLVFVGPDGEVFIHLCRLDALYVLDSPNIQAPLRGADFNALIEAFTNRALPRTGTAAEGSDSRVIRLERGGKVYLHPSALLAALIWTLFLAAEEIVLMTPDADQMAEGLDDIGKLTFGDVRIEGHEVPVIVSENEKLIEDPMGRAVENDPRQIAAHEAFLRDNSTSGLSMTQNSYGLGLSTIAIAFGFMTEQVISQEKNQISDDILSADAEDSLEDDNDTRVLIEDTTLKTNDIATADTVQMATEQTTDTLLIPEESSVETAMTATDAVSEGQLLTDAVQLIQTKIAEAALWIDTTFEGDAPKEIVTAEATPAAEEEPQNTTIVETKAASSLPSFFTLSTLQTALQPFELESYALGDTVVQASFDLNTETIEALSFLDEDLNIDTPASDGLIDLDPGFRSFDDGARAFMDFMLSKLDAIEMVTLSNQMILIDSAVFNASDSYTVSWTLDGGGIISVIGQRSEFVEFDLIA